MDLLGNVVGGVIANVITWLLKRLRRRPRDERPEGEGAAIRAEGDDTLIVDNLFVDVPRAVDAKGRRLHFVDNVLYRTPKQPVVRGATHGGTKGKRRKKRRR